jgi:ligand-binding sensor domain-containing protein
MTNIGCKTIFKARNLLLILLSLQISACTGQVKEKSIPDIKENEIKTQPIILNQNTTFPQIHTNLNGMVREFVRTMHQDKKGNYWFGTNGDGIIRYNGQILEKITITGINPRYRVLEMVEDTAGNLWFGTSEGLIKYNGKEFTTFSKQEGSQSQEIWGLTIDKNGLIWVGSTGGVNQFDGENFIPFSLPDSRVENAKPMLSDKLVFKIVEDKNGTMWFATDGNGVFKYKNGKFIHLTSKNELTDNNVADILEDKQGNIWIGTFYGGVSKFDGKTFTNFTKDGIIAGEEAYNFYEDNLGNIWFTAEGYGVYRYDGKNFKQFTTEDGLTSNVTQSILEDTKGQIWFGSWQGLSIYDGQIIVNAKDKEPWTN